MDNPENHMREESRDSGRRSYTLMLTGNLLGSREELCCVLWFLRSCLLVSVPEVVTIKVSLCVRASVSLSRQKRSLCQSRLQPEDLPSYRGPERQRSCDVVTCFFTEYVACWPEVRMPNEDRLPVPSRSMIYGGDSKVTATTSLNDAPLRSFQP